METTNLSNLTSSELRALARGTGHSATLAARVLAERAAAEERLSALCREVASSRTSRS